MGLLAASFHGWQWQQRQLPKDCWRKATVATIQVNDFPRQLTLQDGTLGQRFPATLMMNEGERCPSVGRVELTLYTASPPLMPGERIRAEIALRPPTSQWSPAMIPDQARHAARGVIASGAVRTLLAVEPAGGWWARSRQAVTEALQANLEPGPERKILRALLVGDATALGDEQWQRFRDLGMAHVLVISGLHVGLVAGGVWSLLGLARRCWRVPGDRGGMVLHTLITLLAAAAYAGLAGFTVPTQRALYMLTVVMLLRLCGWRTTATQALLLALNALLLMNPHAALGGTLWMSAGATWWLLFLAERRAPGRFRVASLLGFQCLLVLGLVPITLFWFGEASLLAIASNLLLVPVLTLWTIPWGLAGVLALDAIPTLTTLCWHWAAWPLPWLLEVMLFAQTRFTPGGVLNVDLDGIQALGLTLLLAGLIQRRRALMLAAGGALVGGLVVQPRPSEAELAVLDVGQGTAVVFSDQQRVLVYDTGGGIPGGFTQAEKVLQPYLNRFYGGRVDMLIVSHGDTDHSAGASYLLTQQAIGRHLGYGGEPCRTGMAWQWGNRTRFTILNGDGQNADASNASSCVLLIEHRGYRLLLAGDIDLSRERDLVRYWRQDLRADWLLVGHHGSQTSSGHTWLKWVSPDVAVLSRARANRFGHPAAPVLDRLVAAGSRVDDTAVDGTLRWRFADNGEVMMVPMRGRWTPYWLRL